MGASTRRRVAELEKALEMVREGLDIANLEGIPSIDEFMRGNAMLIQIIDVALGVPGALEKAQASVAKPLGR